MSLTGALLDPRDWSPRMDQWKANLQDYLARVPEEMRVPIEEVRNSGWLGVIWAVENGLAFIIRIGFCYHCYYIDPVKGQILDLQLDE